MRIGLVRVNECFVVIRLTKKSKGIEKRIVRIEKEKGRIEKEN